MSTNSKRGRRTATVAVPRQLATTTDLKPEDVRAVTEAVNPLIADAFALYVKTRGPTLRSIGHIGRLQTIEDDDEFVPASEMIRRLLTDDRRIAEAQRAAIEVCDEHDDTPTGNILQEILDQTERRIWFLYELSQADE